MPQKIRTATGANSARRNQKKVITHAPVHIKGKFNNPFVLSTVPGGSPLQASARLSRGEE